jgi:hypothetical protein
VHRDIKRILKEIEANGYAWEQGRTHISVKGRNGKGTVASIPLTPGRGRWEHNLRSQLRGLGVLPDNRKKMARNSFAEGSH